MIVPIDTVPVRRSVVVKSSLEDAFDVFTDDVDSWWPRTHHIGKTPMISMVIEPMIGGRCYSRHEDGAEMTWGHVLEWNPPAHLMLAWQVTHDFGHQPELACASEVEVQFTPLSKNLTRVDLEHRKLERHSEHAARMREILDGENGWSTVLKGYEGRFRTPLSGTES